MPRRAPLKVKLRQAALDDLEDIGVYTLERWGERQFVGRSFLRKRSARRRLSFAI
jgi:plasmid stabilization system protein ParE